MSASSSDYREENDWIGGFLEQYELVGHCEVTAKHFRQQYEDYCKQEGQKPEATKTLARKIEKRTGGAVRYAKIHGGLRVWKGLRLIGDAVPDMVQAELDIQEPPDGRFE